MARARSSGWDRWLRAPPRPRARTPSYPPTPCPVLTYCMLLCGVRYGDSVGSRVPPSGTQLVGCYAPATRCAVLN
eukprot:2840742-Rhodomonas_salina.1